jgi:hypothetical protein
MSNGHGSVGYVYFIAYDSAEWRAVLPFVKVGFTNDLDRRMRAFATGTPIPLTVAGYIITEAPEKMEAWLHGQMGMCGCRVNREWFKINKRSMEVIDSLGDQIQENRINELFELPPNDHNDTSYLRKVISNCNDRIDELEELNNVMRKRLIEVDPMSYKYIGKKSIKPSGWATYKRLKPKQ